MSQCRLIRDLFSHARQSTGQPVVVFMDEVDSLCRQRIASEEDHIRRVKTELLHQVCVPISHVSSQSVCIADGNRSRRYYFSLVCYQLSMGAGHCISQKISEEDIH